MRQIQRTVRLGAMLLLVAAQSFAVQPTELEKLARDLQAVLGPGSVEVSGRSVHSDAPIVLSETLLLDAMNRERFQHGLRPLRINRNLSLAAEDRIDDMFRQHYFDHFDPDGVSPFVWAGRRGYQYRVAGENLGVGYRSAGALVRSWMSSPGHRENILKRDFHEVGIAIAIDAPVHAYAGPTVVALYGSR